MLYIYIYIYIYKYINIYLYIYGNHKILISHYGCSYYYVIMGQKEQTHFCIAFWLSPSSQQITLLKYTILQFFLHNNSVTLQYKQSTKSLLYNFNFLNDYTKVKRNNVLSSK